MALDKKPDVIINCAALTNVDGCEKMWDLAYKINAIGPRNLAIAATTVGAKLVHVSTDYVFAGTERAPRTEFDEPNPISAYGKTKLEGEHFVRQFAEKFFILRTAWLYGDGKNFVKTMVRASKTHDEVSVVCDQFGSPTSAVELAKMIHFLEGTDNYGNELHHEYSFLRAALRNGPTDVTSTVNFFHATCEGETNWADFTEAFYKKLGIKSRLRSITLPVREYANMNPDAAKRPAYSNLDNYMLRLTTDQFAMANWEDALDVYLKDFDMENC